MATKTPAYAPGTYPNNLAQIIKDQRKSKEKVCFESGLSTSYFMSLYDGMRPMGPGYERNLAAILGVKPEELRVKPEPPSNVLAEVINTTGTVPTNLSFTDAERLCLSELVDREIFFLRQTGRNLVAQTYEAIGGKLKVSSNDSGPVQQETVISGFPEVPKKQKRKGNPSFSMRVMPERPFTIKELADALAALRAGADVDHVAESCDRDRSEITHLKMVFAHMWLQKDASLFTREHITKWLTERQATGKWRYLLGHTVG